MADNDDARDARLEKALAWVTIGACVILIWMAADTLRPARQQQESSDDAAS
jgi:hypothetical protein